MPVTPPQITPQYRRDPIGLALLVAVSASVSGIAVFNWTLHHLDKTEDASNWALVALGFAQFIVLLGQLRIFYRQQRAMEKQSEIAERQAKLMSEQSAVSVKQTELLTTQTAFMNSQTDALNSQALVTFQNYIATHRPVIRVRTIGSEMSDSRNCIVTQVKISNAGSTNAKIIQWGTVLFRRASPFHTHSDYNEPAMEDVVLEIPKTNSERLILPIITTEKLGKFSLPDIKAGKIQLCLVGRVIYTDDRGTLFETGFARVFEPKASRFMRVDTYDYLSDLEYED